MTRTLAATTALAAALVVVGCSQPTPQVNVATGPVAQGVAVTGTGQVTGTPDTMSVTVSVSVLADDVATAVEDNARTTDAVTAAVRDAGVAPEDIQTSSYSLAPEVDYTETGRKPLGYRATNSVNVTIRNLDAAGDVIDAATSAGGNSTEISNVSFDLEDDAEALTQARQKAFDDARAKAEQFATLAGRTLGQVVSVEETAGTDPVPMSADAITAAGTPIQPGEIKTSVTVAVRWSLD